MPVLSSPQIIHWDLLLRGAVAGLLLLHIVQLALPGARRPARLAVAGFALSLLSYLFCQRSELLVALPPALAWPVLALCVSGTAWLWLAARAVFNDRFAFTPLAVAVLLLGMGAGLVGTAPRLLAAQAGQPFAPAGPSVGQALVMAALTAAALWEVLRGWRDDLVEPRRLARRWVALGVAVYAVVVLAIELALDGRSAGPWLPALHVAGIGALALGLALVVGRHSLDVIVGPPQPEPDAASAPTPTPAPPPALPSPRLHKLLSAMAEQHLHRNDGLTLAGLAEQLGLPEAALRSLINQELGFRNFNDFLHHHRLGDAAPRIANEDLPFLTIALECGYGSIGPFNRAFKQRFGMTPTQYRAAARMRQTAS
jgi:AraC-like DNA-binding protein